METSAACNDVLTCNYPYKSTTTGRAGECSVAMLSCHHDSPYIQPSSALTRIPCNPYEIPLPGVLTVAHVPLPQQPPAEHQSPPACRGSHGSRRWYPGACLPDSGRAAKRVGSLPWTSETIRSAGSGYFALVPNEPDSKRSRDSIRDLCEEKTEYPYQRAPSTQGQDMARGFDIAG